MYHLSVRVHSCPHCGYTTNRDVAAGQNIRNRGICLISTVGQTESKAPVQPHYRGLRQLSLGKWRNLAFLATRKPRK